MSYGERARTWSPLSQHPYGDEPGSRVYGQQLARVEEDLLRTQGKLEEILHPAGPAPELDDVAALHGGREIVYEIPVHR